MIGNVVGTVFCKEACVACIYNSNGEIVGHLANGGYWRLLDKLVINHEMCYQISNDKYIPKRYITFKDGIRKEGDDFFEESNYDV